MTGHGSESQRRGEGGSRAAGRAQAARSRAAADGCHTIAREADGVCVVRLTGDWRTGTIRTAAREPLAEASGCGRLVCDGSAVEAWDSALLVFLLRLKRGCEAAGVACEWRALPDGARRLLALATAAPVWKAPPRQTDRGLLTRAGERAASGWAALAGELSFVGGVTAAFGRLLAGRACMRRSDIVAFLYACGVQALPIVSLISALVGLIFAFVGAVQLTLFGAQIYVAGLVGIAIVRIMGAIMTGIMLAGRTGAAFAAQIGAMQVNEEIDALATLGVDPIDFLVLPRMIALAVMTPVLCLYANLMGILGGMVVSVFLFEITPMEYIHMTRETVRIEDLWVGLAHSAVFGVLVAYAGCRRGLRCGRSAAAVGEAATGAVVSGIIGIIVATAILTVMCNALGI